MSEQIRKARKVKERYETAWMKIDGVTAIGLGMEDEQVVIIVSVRLEPETFHNLIPSDIDGIPVIIKQSGDIKTQ